MRFRKILTILLFVVIALPTGVLAKNDSPNIVLIFMDNFGWGEIGAYGDRKSVV